ncbi:hypothetical protein [Nocardiopsis sp. NRRL B-16309]|uniref:hypothetical protein n=1 Tax=Nocardiopsis sp. NRRL B-16309 TaxID=1519494 RepID=UPI0006AE3948|nr:hypothetical protein [Nocardiopsis sp. NRRL B-16309]KOX13189.1 hypothetical protein ADL05_19690 [Nocardiopsis sp. NRRL B-16309]
MQALSGLANLIGTMAFSVLTFGHLAQGDTLFATCTGIAAICTATTSFRSYRRAHLEQMDRSSESTTHPSPPSTE